MAKQRPVQNLNDLGLVWSSDSGDHRKDRANDERRGAGSKTGSSAGSNAGGSGQTGGERVKVRRETAGRRGKTATTVSGVALRDDQLRELAGRLKKRCGVGGSAKNGTIEIQGDHRDLIVELLRAEGYDVVLAGG